ncbi:predicted protein [Botrytis cinerea T4]|uniref:Uncharacterized protein n=1 Tax=Botryotinia fuckeliana (strain T4) TaxID=999810 RepID=G2XYI8_BOTF4|nr:predicted protein [Botrytis cinerea T4]
MLAHRTGSSYHQYLQRLHIWPSTYREAHIAGAYDQHCSRKTIIILSNSPHKMRLSESQMPMEAFDMT